MADKRIFDLTTIKTVEDIDEHTWIWMDKQAPEGEPAEPSWKVRGDLFLKVLNNFATHFVPNVATVEGKCYWHDGELYVCDVSYTGDWVPGNFTLTSVDELFARKDVQSALQTAVSNLTTYAQNVAHSIAPEFDQTKPNDAGGYAYYAGEIVTNNGVAYRFKVNHSSGAWNPAEVDRYDLTEEISKNDGSFISSFTYDDIVDGAVKLDGTLVLIPGGGWKAIYKVPVKKGDVFELNGASVVSTGYANVVVYDEDGDVVEAYATSNFFRRFTGDGFVSITFNQLQNVNDAVRFSPALVNDTLFEKKSIVGKNFVESSRCSLFLVQGLLQESGKVSLTSYGVTLYKIPVSIGDLVRVKNSGSYTSPSATLVFYNQQGQVQYTHASQDYEFYAPADGFVSISHLSSQVDFKLEIKSSKGFNFEDVVGEEEKERLLCGDLSSNVLEKCYKEGAVKTDGTFVPMVGSGWKAVDKFQLRKGGILIAYDLATTLSSSYASYVVTDVDGLVLDYGTSNKFFIEATQDCFVSLTGKPSFSLSKIFLKYTEFYSFAKSIDSRIENFVSKVEDTLAPLSKYFLDSVAQVMKKCTFIGDSITCGFIEGGDIHVGGETAKALKQNWAEYLCLGKGMTCTNIAVSGSSTHHWRYGGVLAEVTVSIDNANIPTDAYFVALGVNDKRLGLSLGSSSDIKSDYNENADSMYGNYDYIVRKIHSFNPYAKIFVLTTGANESNMNSYNEAIRYVASLYDYVYLIDLWNEEFFTSAFCLNNLWIGGHFTPVGESCLSQIVWKKLNELIYDNISSMTYIPYYPGM